MRSHLQLLLLVGFLAVGLRAQDEDSEGPTPEEDEMTDNCKDFDDGGFCTRDEPRLQRTSAQGSDVNQEELTRRLQQVFGTDGQLAAMFEAADEDPYRTRLGPDDDLDDPEPKETTPPFNVGPTRRPRRNRVPRPPRPSKRRNPNRPRRRQAAPPTTARTPFLSRARRDAEAVDSTRVLTRTKRQVDLTFGQPFVSKCRERCWRVSLRPWHWVLVRGRGWVRPVHWPPFIRQSIIVCIPCHRVQPFCFGATREVWGQRTWWRGRCVAEVKYKLVLVWYSGQFPWVRWVWVRYPQGCCCVPWMYGIPRNLWDSSPRSLEVLSDRQPQRQKNNDQDHNA